MTDSWPMTLSEMEAVSSILSLNEQLNQRFQRIVAEAHTRINAGKSTRLAFDLERRLWLRATEPGSADHGEAPKS